MTEKAERTNKTATNKGSYVKHHKVINNFE